MSAAAAERKEELPKTKTIEEPKATQSKPSANGLWVNWEFLRKLTRRPPQTVLPGESSAEYSRFLNLADIALSQMPEQRKGETQVIAFRKPSELKKSKAR